MKCSICAKDELGQYLNCILGFNFKIELLCPTCYAWLVTELEKHNQLVYT